MVIRSLLRVCYILFRLSERGRFEREKNGATEGKVQACHAIYIYWNGKCIYFLFVRVIYLKNTIDVTHLKIANKSKICVRTITVFYVQVQCKKGCYYGYTYKSQQNMV